MPSIKERKTLGLTAIFMLIVIASVWMAVAISQASSEPTGDGTGSVSTEGKAFWHKDIKNKMFGEKHEGSSKWMEYKKAKFDAAVDEGLITEEQKETLLNIFTGFYEGEITWEEKLKLIEEAGIDLKQLFSHGSKWKSNKSSSHVL